MTTPRLYRIRKVMENTGMARSTIYLRISQGLFPEPFKLDGTTATVWVADEVDEWVYAQIQKRRNGRERLERTVTEMFAEARAAIDEAALSPAGAEALRDLRIAGVLPEIPANAVDLAMRALNDEGD